MGIGEEEKLPIDYKKDKKYTGKLIYSATAYMGEDLGRVHDWTYHGEPVLHVLQDGDCPSCCKEYSNEDFLETPMSLDTLCECEKHWIFVLPKSKYQGSTVVKIFEIIRTISK